MAFGTPALQLVARTHIHELGIACESWMHLADQPKHLLGDPPVVGVALRGGPELAHGVNLAQLHPEVPANPVGERDHVLRDGRPEVAPETRAWLGGALDAIYHAMLHAELGAARRHGKTA